MPGAPAAALGAAARWALREAAGPLGLGRARGLAGAAAGPRLAYESIRIDGEGKMQIERQLARDDMPWSAAGDRKLCMFVHGMLGAGKNWRSFSGNLMRAARAAGRANWGMVLVDLRNHGRSSRTAGLEGPHTLEAAAGDLIDLCEAEFGGKTPDLLVGHSLGGKVVLEYLRTLRQRGGLQLPESAWVLDSVPNRVPPGPTTREIEHVLKAVRPLYDAPVPSRKWLHETLSAQGFSEAFIGWLGSSLERDPANKAFYWNFDLDGVAEMFRSYCDSDYLADLAAPPAGTEVNLVVAERSDRWTFETLEALEGLAATTPNFLLRHLADAGHWLHVDNPAGLLGMVRSAVE